MRYKNNFEQIAKHGVTQSIVSDHVDRSSRSPPDVFIQPHDVRKHEYVAL